jgi:hypothetical protein
MIVAASWRADKPGLKKIELGAPVQLALTSLSLAIWASTDHWTRAA